jgi:pimeloyl-ACP methyl ester carboxylesterase/DNA-binding CsgD family transcriptional regulator
MFLVLAGRSPLGIMRIRQMASQEIHFCKSSDGAKIAYAVEGSGPPLMYLGLWTYSVNYPRNPLYMGLRDGLASERTVFSFDRRGIGLSQREVGQLSVDLTVSDADAVATAGGLGEFDVVGAYDGAQLAVAYCARHSGRVRRLILLGLCRSVRSVFPASTRGLDRFVNTNWDAGALAMAAVALRNASSEALEALATAYKGAMTQDAALKYMSFVASLDSTPTLPAISVPALVVHWREDPMVPLDEAREAAALIPGSRLIVVEGSGPPWTGDRSFLDPMLAFLREGDAALPPAGLTGREAEILSLLAAGRSNLEIAAALSISSRTAERHIQNIYVKTDSHNRAEATAFAFRHGIIAPPPA